MLDWLALELLSVVSVLLLCEQQLQLPWVLDWLALELLSVPSVLLCEHQLQLPWVLDWLALELLLLQIGLLSSSSPSADCTAVTDIRRSCRRRSIGLH